jgi:hypothetical protein
MNHEEKIAELRESNAALREEIEQRRATNADAECDEFLARLEHVKSPDMTPEQRDRIMDDLRRGAAAQQEMIRRMTEQPPAEVDPVVEGATMLMFGDPVRGELLADLLTDIMATQRKAWRADIDALRREIADGEKVINFADLRRTA